jgi:glycosyltransferase involved in cell wall biosynthesis
VNLTSNGEAEVIESPESLDPLYARAAVVVAPIRLGHGTRIKVLEAASHGRAMVATTEALKGHPLEHEKHLLVADTTADFASACIRLLQSQNDQLRLALEARKKAMMLGGWDRSAALALEVINKTIEG